MLRVRIGQAWTRKLPKQVPRKAEKCCKVAKQRENEAALSLKQKIHFPTCAPFFGLSQVRPRLLILELLGAKEKAWSCSLEWQRSSLPLKTDRLRKRLLKRGRPFSSSFAFARSFSFFSSDFLKADTFGSHLVCCLLCLLPGPT